MTDFLKRHGMWISKNVKDCYIQILNERLLVVVPFKINSRSFIAAVIATAINKPFALLYIIVCIL